MSVRDKLFAGIIAGATIALFAPARATADDAACNAWEIEYTLAANVELSDTMMGAGDGVHTIGPGRLVLRYENRNGQPLGIAKLVAYEMKDNFTVDAKSLFGGTKVTNDTHTTVTPNVCGVSAEGIFSERVLRWTTLVNGMHTDGKVTCTGGFCGRFGAPPQGTSDVHTPPHPVQFKTFDFAPDSRAFTMGYSITAKSTTPSQTSKITLAGREARRTCVTVQPCP